MVKKNYQYEINGDGRDNMSLSSHPASDRINDLDSSLYDRTGEVYDRPGCGCEIDPADREKRIEELDELIHDKIGDRDEHIKANKKEHQVDYKKDNIKDNVKEYKEEHKYNRHENDNLNRSKIMDTNDRMSKDNSQNTSAEKQL